MNDKFAIYYMPIYDPSVTKQNIEGYIKKQEKELKKIQFPVRIIFMNEKPKQDQETMNTDFKTQ